jgi:23S rRNA G2069 N7-methylase RlmK/C1962 C5-methylase RlmI
MENPTTEPVPDGYSTEQFYQYVTMLKDSIRMEIERIAPGKKFARLDTASKLTLVYILMNLKEYQQTGTYIDENLVRLYLRKHFRGQIQPRQSVNADM